MAIHPYLFLEGRCDEAIAFYGRALGAQVKMLMRVKDNPDAGPGCAGLPPGSDDKVLHAELDLAGATLFLSDGMCSGRTQFSGFSLSVSTDTDAQARQVFDALADGGQVQMPLDKTFFTSSFGMLTDAYGVGWMVVCKAA